MEKEEIKNIRKAGEIAKQVKEYVKSIVKPGIKLLEIAEKIESKIEELGGKPAFPVNLSMNELAAHYTPSWNDETLASGLLKVDFGIHVDGYIADTAISFDLENSKENKALIEAAELALKEALKIVKLGTPLGQIGAAIEKTIKAQGFQPIVNLSGHGIEQYDLHAGITIPNYDTKQSQQLAEGLYAIEPFATSGVGLIRDGGPSGIYQIVSESQVRDSFAREVLAFIQEEYELLPFCSRWIHKKFGSRSLIALKRLEEAQIIKQYSQLIEKGQGKVAQAEHTILVDKETIITTL